MSTVLFIFSKVFWFFTRPDNLLFVLIALGAVTCWLGVRRYSRLFLGAGLALFFAMSFLPLDNAFLRPLEGRFGVPAFPEGVNGIIALGGAIDVAASRGTGQIALNGSAERVVTFLSLARKYPNARLLYSSGSGAVFNQEDREADAVANLLPDFGIDPSRLIIERESRNTRENAVAALALASPGEGEKWILLTSAFHMPRAYGSFARLGWDVIPYPVDFRVRRGRGSSLRGGLFDNAENISLAVKEWLGLVAYRVMGRTNAFFPSPIRGKD